MRSGEITTRNGHSGVNINLQKKQSQMMIKASTLDIAKHKDPIFIVCTQTKYSQNLISEKHIY